MHNNQIYTINPDRTQPWNELPTLPIPKTLYRDVEIYEQLGKSKEALAYLSGRSIAIPNPSMLHSVYYFTGGKGFKRHRKCFYH